jgi:hypothetical protein
MMEIFDIYITYVSWDGGGKTRPVLVLEKQTAVVSVFNITTQYANKSPTIRDKYFEIADWRYAGLDKQSYVDTNTIRDLPLSVLDSKAPIGKLSESDKLRLLAFLSE